MTADTIDCRLGKLCNSTLSRRREAVRWLRGRTFQAELRVQRLAYAWPDEDRRSPTQVATIERAQLFAASCRAALVHHLELLDAETRA